ncbi:MAG TPA: hypothetical protein DDZ92_03885 [Halomonas sp.]|nr:hypothetical protein [Halomonas sp.]|tara:strand:- start:203 stop:664 length:462 start_codon:yes stop_codon:yes gene_type:complete
MAAKKAPAKKLQKRQIERWTPAKIEKVLDIVANGHTLMYAAREIGEKYRALYDHIHEHHKAAYERVRRMGADALVQKADDDLTPTADGANLAPHQVTLRVARSKQHLWRAERSDPDYWAERKNVKHSGDAEAPIKIEHLPPQEAYLALIGGRK